MSKLIKTGVLLITAAALCASAFLFAARIVEKPALSSLSEDECLKFLSGAGVVLPEDFINTPVKKAGIKKLIVDLEENPDKIFIISNTSANEFIESIRSVVKNHLGIQ